VTPSTTGRSRISKRLAAAVAAVALAVAAPAALAATSSSSSQKPVVHVAIQRSGTVVVSGYDGGAPLTAGGR
jgi:VIT1/CCC1 family predicted Fe2+/Mn2+ transporter